MGLSIIATDEWVPQIDESPKVPVASHYKWVWHRPSSTLHFENITNTKPMRHHDEIMEDNYGDDYEWKDFSTGMASFWPGVDKQDEKGEWKPQPPDMHYVWYERAPAEAKQQVEQKLRDLHPDAWEQHQESPYSALGDAIEPSHHEGGLPGHLGGRRPVEGLTALSGEDSTWNPSLEEDDKWAKRRPWLLDASNLHNPNPVMWIGKPGEFHPLVSQFCMNNRIGVGSDVLRGALDERTDPATFVCFDYPNAGEKRDWAKAQILRAYTQQQDNPESRKVAGFPGEHADKIVYHPDLQQFANDGAMQARVPWMYDPEADMLHIGPGGIYHSDLRRGVRKWREENMPPAKDDEGPWRTMSGAYMTLPFSQEFHNMTYIPRNKSDFGDEDAEKHLKRATEILGTPLTETSRNPDSMLTMCYDDEDAQRYHQENTDYPATPEDWLPKLGSNDTALYPQGRTVQHKGGENSADTTGQSEFHMRTPYIYDMKNDLIHWGEPGQFHSDLKQQVRSWYDKNQDFEKPRMTEGWDDGTQSAEIPETVNGATSNVEDYCREHGIDMDYHDIQGRNHAIYDWHLRDDPDDPDYEEFRDSDLVRGRLEHLVGQDIDPYNDPDGLVMGLSQMIPESEDQSTWNYDPFKTEQYPGITQRAQPTSPGESPPQFPEKPKTPSYDWNPRIGAAWKDKYDYKKATDDRKSCITCSAFKAGKCEMFDNAKVDPGFTCSEWSDTWTKEAAMQDGSIVTHTNENIGEAGFPWTHRKPYIYDGKNDLLHIGHPGWYHADLQRELGSWYDKHGLEPDRDRVQGGIITHPDTGEQWNVFYPYGSARLHQGRIEQLVGMPITENYDPDTIMDKVDDGPGSSRTPTPDSDSGSSDEEWVPRMSSSDWMSQSADNWWGPQSIDKFKVEVPGDAPGMGGAGYNVGEGNDFLRSPCWCEYGEMGTIPHEWGPKCADGMHPTLPEQAHTAASDQWPPPEDEWVPDIEAPIPPDYLRRYTPYEPDKPSKVTYHKFLYHPLHGLHHWGENKREDDFYPSHREMQNELGWLEMRDDGTREYGAAPGVVTVRPDHVSLALHREILPDIDIPKMKSEVGKFYREMYPSKPVYWHAGQASDGYSGGAERVAAEGVPGNAGHWDSPRPNNENGVDESPNRTQNWVWLDGHVAFGGDHHDIVLKLARELGYPEEKVAYLSNLLARNHAPQDMAIATGELKGDYPHIWMSTRDRNAIWDDVARARDTKIASAHPQGCPECGAEMFDGKCDECDYGHTSDQAEPYDSPYGAFTPGVSAPISKIAAEPFSPDPDWEPELNDSEAYRQIWKSSIPFIYMQGNKIAVGRPGQYHMDIPGYSRTGQALMYGRCWPDKGVYVTYYGDWDDVTYDGQIELLLNQHFGVQFTHTVEPQFKVASTKTSYGDPEDEDWEPYFGTRPYFDISVPYEFTHGGQISIGEQGGYHADLDKSHLNPAAQRAISGRAYPTHDGTHGMFNMWNMGKWLNDHKYAPAIKAALEEHYGRPFKHNTGEEYKVGAVLRDNDERPHNWKWGYNPDNDDFRAWQCAADGSPDHADMLSEWRGQWITGRGADDSIWINRNEQSPARMRALELAARHRFSTTIPGMQITHSMLNLPSGPTVWVSATDPQGTMIGKMMLRASDGLILDVTVPEAYRRSGVATALFQYAQANGLHPQHSSMQSEMAQQWAPTLKAANQMSLFDPPANPNDFQYPEYDGVHSWADDISFMDRTPYIYYPGNDHLYKGQPGMYHDTLKAWVHPQENIVNYEDQYTTPSVYGSIYTNPDRPEQQYQAVHRNYWTNAYNDPDAGSMTPEGQAHMEQRLGLPFTHNDDPETWDADQDWDDYDWEPKLSWSQKQQPNWRSKRVDVDFVHDGYGGSGGGTRRPVVYNKDEDTAYVGPYNSSHASVLLNAKPEWNALMTKNDLTREDKGWGYDGALDDAGYLNMGYGALYDKYLPPGQEQYRWYQGPMPDFAMAGASDLDEDEGEDESYQWEPELD